MGNVLRTLLGKELFIYYVTSLGGKGGLSFDKKYDKCYDMINVCMRLFIYCITEEDLEGINTNLEDGDKDGGLDN